MIDVLNKVIVVVGGTGKIGSFLCANLANSGAIVVSLSRGPSSEINSNIIHKRIDATSLFEFKTLIEDVVSEFGSISALVNCSCYRPLANNVQTRSDLEISLWTQSILQNSLLLHVPTSLISQYMANHKICGSVVTISSIYGIVGPTFAIYDGTKMTTELDYAYNKSAAIGYTRYMASKYAKNKIRFNVIAPGGFLDRQEETFIANYSKSTPLSRMADYNEICGLVEYLCSDSSTYLTGSVIPLDGGWTAV